MKAHRFLLQQKKGESDATYCIIWASYRYQSLTIC